MPDTNAPTAFTLSLGQVTMAEPALTLASGLPRQTPDGVPCHYVWRELLHAGDFVHPSTGQHIPVSLDRMAKWERNFREMQRGGVNVYVPAGHPKPGQAPDPDRNRGWVKDMRIRDGRLEGMLQLIGDDAKLTAARNQISVRIFPNFKDGHGRVYDEAIEHAAIVSDPVVPNQSEAIAASRSADGGSADAPVYVLSRSDQPPEQPTLAREGADPASGDTLPFPEAGADLNRRPPMADATKMVPVTDGHVTRAKKHLSSPETLNHENLVERMLHHCETAPQGKPDEEPDGDEAEETKKLSRGELLAERDIMLSRISEELEPAIRALADERDALAAQATDLSRGGTAPVDADVLQDRAELATAKIDLAVAQGELTPVMAERLKQHVMPDGQPSAFMLSRHAGVDARPVELLLAIVKGEKIGPALGSRTGLQQASPPHLELSRAAGATPPPDDQNPLMQTARSMYPERIAK